LPYEEIHPQLWYQDSDWDATLKNVAVYREGQSRAALTALEGQVRAALASATAGAALERRLLQTLSSPATLDGKRFICRQLALIGSAQAVPTLAALLVDPELADMARYALEPNPDPAVDRALLEALSKTSGRLRIGIVGSLGARRSAAAVQPLSRLVRDADDPVAGAAATALEKIGTPEVLPLLLELGPQARSSLRPQMIAGALAVASAQLARGEKQAAERAFLEIYKPTQSRTVRTSALQGLLAVDSTRYFPLVLGVLRSEHDPLQPYAADVLRTLPGKNVFVTVATELPHYSSEVQVLVLKALGQRGDAAALPAVLTAEKSPQESVRLAAMQAIGSLGNADQVPLLIEVCASGKESEATVARVALTQLRGGEVDAAILKALVGASPKVQRDLLQVLAGRNAVVAVPILLRLIGTAVPEVQEEIYQALGVLATETHLPALVKLLGQAGGTEQSEAIAKALTAAVTRFDDADKWTPYILESYQRMNLTGRCLLLRLLRHSGTAAALTLLRREMQSSDTSLRDAALRALAEWPSTEPVSDLLKIAREGATTTQRILAYRGVVRMGERCIKSSPAASVKILNSALEAAPREEEKRLVLGVLARVARVDALEMAQSCLESKSLVNEASMAVLKIGDAIHARYPEPVRKAAAQVLAITRNEKLKKQAQALLEKLRD
jgi:HEAT repeat protein